MAEPHRSVGGWSQGTAGAVARRPAAQILTHTWADRQVAAGAASGRVTTSLGWRVAEFTIALAVVILTLPVMLLIAVIIRLDSRGPALFFQSRLGRHARPFWFVKFRTMYVDARRRFPELYAYRYDEDEIRTVRFKVQNDPRVTRFGRWLRKTSLDELPNFWNVLTGDMALVGPRPDIPEMLPYYRGEEHLKFQVRPGVTGFAQTCGRGDLTFRETLRLDVAYVKARSVILDIKVLWRTIRMVVVGSGAF
jgi:lipopolysaccharide/colanic/teichoic acid biosynthesis glycosyltransferase